MDVCLLLRLNVKKCKNFHNLVLRTADKRATMMDIYTSEMILMKMIRRFLAMALILCLCLMAFGCAQPPVDNGGESSTPSSEPTVPSSEASQPNDGKVTYTVHVVDEAGKPVTGGMIQFCLNSCMPCMLDAQGNATMKLTPANYKVSFTMMPAGYTLAGDKTEFYFEAGSYEMTIVLKAA